MVEEAGELVPTAVGTNHSPFCAANLRRKGSQRANKKKMVLMVYVHTVYQYSCRLTSLFLSTSLHQSTSVLHISACLRVCTRILVQIHTVPGRLESQVGLDLFVVHC